MTLSRFERVVTHPAAAALDVTLVAVVLTILLPRFAMLSPSQMIALAVFVVVTASWALVTLVVRIRVARRIGPGGRRQWR